MARTPVPVHNYRSGDPSIGSDEKARDQKGNARREIGDGKFVVRCHDSEAAGHMYVHSRGFRINHPYTSRPRGEVLLHLLFQILCCLGTRDHLDSQQRRAVNILVWVNCSGHRGGHHAHVRHANGVRPQPEGHFTEDLARTRILHRAQQFDENPFGGLIVPRFRWRHPDQLSSVKLDAIAIVGQFGEPIDRQQGFRRHGFILLSTVFGKNTKWTEWKKSARCRSRGCGTLITRSGGSKRTNGLRSLALPPSCSQRAPRRARPQTRPV